VVHVEESITETAVTMISSDVASNKRLDAEQSDASDEDRSDDDDDDGGGDDDSREAMKGAMRWRRQREQWNARPADARAGVRVSIDAGLALDDFLCARYPSPRSSAPPLFLLLS
jgi:hypothetical protein